MTKTRYGVTWATERESVIQTGYDFHTIGEARRAALAGPDAYGGYVSEMAHSHDGPGESLFGVVEGNDYVEYGRWLVYR